MNKARQTIRERTQPHIATANGCDIFVSLRIQAYGLGRHSPRTVTVEPESVAGSGIGRTAKKGDAIVAEHGKSRVCAYQSQSIRHCSQGGLATLGMDFEPADANLDSVSIEAAAPRRLLNERDLVLGSAPPCICLYKLGLDQRRRGEFGSMAALADSNGWRRGVAGLRQSCRRERRRP